MKTFKRILSIVLVLVMTVTAVPAFVSSSPKAEAVKIFGKTAYYTKDDLKSGYIELGSYPQSRVTNSTLIAALEDQLVSSVSTQKWVNYGYYSGTDDYGTMQQSAYMMYTDVMYNSAKYRYVLITEYRPVKTWYSLSPSITYQGDNGYTIGGYWFKFEPLKWRVLDEDTGLIMCENIIDSQAYCNTVYRTKEAITASIDDYYKYTYYSDAAHTYKQNEYAKSSIRAWLNDDFYNTAFSSIDKTAIDTSRIDDFGPEAERNKSLYIDGKYLDDKIFLLGQTEATTAKYGFNTNWKAEDSKRLATGTDYAKCQGLYVNSNGNSSWYLRTALGATLVNNEWHGSQVETVNWDGGCATKLGPEETFNGVRPCLKINLHTHSYTASEKVGQDATHTSPGYKFCYCVCGESVRRPIEKTTEHQYTSSTVEATCTEDGLITYSCPCGHKYTEVIPAGHKFEGNNAACENCDYVCSCNCHKTGISKFFFSIALFFQKLFGNNKVCACGRNHY